MQLLSHNNYYIDKNILYVDCNNYYGTEEWSYCYLVSNFLPLIHNSC